MTESHQNRKKIPSPLQAGRHGCLHGPPPYSLHGPPGRMLRHRRGSSTSGAQQRDLRSTSRDPRTLAASPTRCFANHRRRIHHRHPTCSTTAASPPPPKVCSSRNIPRQHRRRRLKVCSSRKPATSQGSSAGHPWQQPWLLKVAKLDTQCSNTPELPGSKRQRLAAAGRPWRPACSICGHLP